MKQLLTILLFSTSSYAFCFQEAAAYYGVHPSLLYAIAKVESNFHPYAINVNSGGKSLRSYYPKTKEEAIYIIKELERRGYNNYDVGIGQINSRNIKRYNLKVENLLDPCYNLHMSAFILRKNIDTYGYNWKAIYKYNGNPSYAWKIYRELKKMEVAKR
ncbi:MAG: transglycosylase SLT domain-containing protein [Candidatus Omnitrophica bacterium]|nr:transglycosylase SLT domain-containing protein [Candidatus Omnitrophota bacterium]